MKINIHCIYLTKRMVRERDILYLKFYAKLTPLEGKCRFSIDIRSYSTSAVTSYEKSSVNTNEKSTYVLFNESKLSLSPQRGQKRKTADCKIALHLKNVCYKVSLCEYCQRQRCKAFTGLSIRAKVVCGDVPYYVKIWPKLPNPLQKRRFPINIRS